MSDLNEDRRARGSADDLLEGMTEDQLVELIDEALNRLPPQKLQAVREAIDTKRRQKEEDTRRVFMEKMRSEAEKMGLSWGTLFPMPASGSAGRKARRDAGQPLPVRYRGPNGEQWSGRGVSPRWIREHEEKGGSKEDYRVS